MASSAKNASNGLASNNVSVEDLSKQIEILKADISTLTTTIGDLAKSKSVEAGATAKLKAKEVTEAGREKALEAQLHAEDFVRTQPATALGVAAGLGFLVGLFTARR